MKDNSYEDLAKKYINTIVLRLRGKFYNAYDESAIIVGGLLKYKVRRGQSGKYKVGFPVESLDKVIDCMKNEHVDFIIFEAENISAHVEFENNQFLNLLKLFDASSMEIINSESEKSVNNDKAVPVQNKNESLNIVNQRTLFVQGQGITLENALIDAQKIIEKLISQKKKIVSVALMENRSTEARDAILVQGLIVYEMT